MRQTGYKILLVICGLMIVVCMVLCIDSCMFPRETELIYVPGYYEDAVVVIPTRTPVTGIIRCQADPQGVRSGMPCDRYEETEHEQETVEETTVEETVPVETVGAEVVPQVNDSLPAVSETETQTASEILPTAHAHDPGTVPGAPAPTDIPEGDAEVPADDLPAGDMDEDCPEGDAMALGDLEDYLRGQLAEAGVEWFYPYAWCQVMQESNWNPWAENANGQDKGLLQYRLQYWQEPESIFDPYAQIRRYVREVTARINAGLSVEEVISRHFTSDYVGGINWEYVNHVMRWMR